MASKSGKKVSFEAMLQECFTPHSLVHVLMGVGVGLIILSFVPSLMSNALVLGVLIVVVGFLADWMIQKKG